MHRFPALIVGGGLLLSPAPGDDPASFLPGPEELRPLAPAGPTERYTAENLWEKIDGEAELFRRYGLSSAVFKRFEHPADPDHSQEIAIFIVDSPLEAFGLFASFRSTDLPVENIGNGGVLGDHLALLWHGRYFMLLDSQGPEDSRPRDLRKALEAVAARLGPAPPRPPLLKSFLELARAETVRYLPDHLLGREVLPPGLIGTHDSGLEIFRGTGPVSETPILKVYRKILESPQTKKWGGAFVLSGRDPVLGPVSIGIKGDRLAGARAEADHPRVQEIVLRLLDLPGP